MIITDDIQQKIAEIAKKHGLKLVVLFGSQVSGQTHKMSDVDIGYISPRSIDYRESYTITRELAPLFKNPEVELVNMRTAPPLLLREIVSVCKVLYAERVSLLDELYVYAMRAYEEAQPLFDAQAEYVQDVIKKYQHAR